MHITVHYMAQLKRAAGLAQETVEVESDCTLADLLERLAQHRGQAFRSLILNDTGQPHPSLLLFVGDNQISGDWRLRDWDSVTLLTPMAGG